MQISTPYWIRQSLPPRRRRFLTILSAYPLVFTRLSSATPQYSPFRIHISITQFASKDDDGTACFIPFVFLRTLSLFLVSRLYHREKKVQQRLVNKKKCYFIDSVLFLFCFWTTHVECSKMNNSTTSSETWITWINRQSIGPEREYKRIILYNYQRILAEYQNQLVSAEQCNKWCSNPLGGGKNNILWRAPSTLLCLLVVGPPHAWLTKPFKQSINTHTSSMMFGRTPFARIEEP